MSWHWSDFFTSELRDFTVGSWHQRQCIFWRLHLSFGAGLRARVGVRNAPCLRKATEFTSHRYPIGSMYAIYGNIYHQYTPNVSIYTSTMDPMGYGLINDIWYMLILYHAFYSRQLEDGFCVFALANMMWNNHSISGFYNDDVADTNHLHTTCIHLRTVMHVQVGPPP